MLPYETRALAQATRMIAAKGETVTWEQVSTAVIPDPTKPWAPGAAAPVLFAGIKILFLPSNRKTLALLQYLTQTEIVLGYQRGLMAGNVPFTPALKDFIVHANGKKDAIKYLDVLKPAGNPLLWYIGIEP